MIHTVLLDLDDTLLANRMDTFLPAYFQLLGSHLASLVDERKMRQELLAGTRDMLANLDPCTTLEQAFSRHFYPALGLIEAEARPAIEAFYHGPYKDLQRLTSTIQGAHSLVNEFHSRGLEIVIATNPLFPRIAVDERLRWAGLAPETKPFTLVASYEDLHFAKPQPEYYAEILARLGREPAEALMIGDSLELDLLPAHNLGMQVFHVVDTRSPDNPSGDIHAIPPELLPMEDTLKHAAHATDTRTSSFPSGSLEAFPLKLLDPPSSPVSDPLDDPRILLARLRAVPAALRVMTSCLNPDTWALRPLADEWAAVEIICHLRDVELDVNLPRLEAILNQPFPHLPAFNTDPWAEERSYITLDGQTTQDEFCLARLELIDTLSKLSPDDWDRAGRHSLLGPTTLRELMKFTTQHDWLHLAQLRKTIQSMMSSSNN